MRGLFKGFAVSGVPEKGIDFAYECFTTTPKPPICLPVDLDAIEDVRGKIGSLTKDVENAEAVTKDKNLIVDS